jgi:hypothetical protein
MYKHTLLVASLIAFSFSSSAQTETGIGKSPWKVGSFGVNLGGVRDSYQKMDLSSMYDLTKNPALLDRDLTGYEEDIQRVSGGATVGLNLTLISDRGNSGWQHEIRLGGSFSSREPMIHYRQPGVDPASSTNTLIYCHVVNEFNVSGAYLFRKSPKAAPWFSVYGGLGVNVGSSFNSKVMVIENSFEWDNPSTSTNSTSAYQGKESIFSRVYAPVGVQFQLFNHFNLGLETNIGVGMQNVIGGDSYFMPITTGVQLLVSYSF